MLLRRLDYYFLNKNYILAAWLPLDLHHYLIVYFKEFKKINIMSMGIYKAKWVNYVFASAVFLI